MKGGDTRGPRSSVAILIPLKTLIFDAEGYFMGDLACRDRSTVNDHRGVKDLIIRGGENISAKEVEDVLHRHPAVLGPP
jgi:non-ribosomal peptide synthetase component E (peptide arylation enzyme)